MVKRRLSDSSQGPDEKSQRLDERLLHQEQHVAEPMEADDSNDDSGVRLLHQEQHATEPMEVDDSHDDSDVRLLNQEHVAEPMEVDNVKEPPPYTFEECCEKMPRQFGYEEKKFKVKFNKEYMGRRLVDVQGQLKGMFQDVMNRALQDYGNDDKASIVVQHNDLKKDIVIHMRKNKDITTDTIMGRMEKVLQSDEELSIDNSFEINFGLLRTDRGGGRVAITNTDIKDKNNSLIKKKCVTMIPELKDDVTCAARAIVVCLARLNNDPHLKMQET